VLTPDTNLPSVESGERIVFRSDPLNFVNEIGEGGESGEESLLDSLTLGCAASDD